MVRAVAVACLLASALARAQPRTDDELARRHYEAGQAHWDRGEIAEALHEYEAAHQLSRYPAILYRIALCQERLGRLDDALATVDRYIEAEPHGERRAEVDRLRADLRAQLAARRAPVFVAAPAPVAGAEPAPAIVQPALPAPPKLRKPGLALLGTGAGLLVLGCVFTGLAAQANDEILHPSDGTFHPSAQSRRDGWKAADAAAFAVGGAAVVTGVHPRDGAARRWCTWPSGRQWRASGRASSPAPSRRRCRRRSRR